MTPSETAGSSLPRRSQSTAPVAPRPPTASACVTGARDSETPRPTPRNARADGRVNHTPDSMPTERRVETVSRTSKANSHPTAVVAARSDRRRASSIEGERRPRPEARASGTRAAVRRGCGCDRDAGCGCPCAFSPELTGRPAAPHGAGGIESGRHPPSRRFGAGRPPHGVCVVCAPPALSTGQQIRGTGRLRGRRGHAGRGNAAGCLSKGRRRRGLVRPCAQRKFVRDRQGGARSRTGIPPRTRRANRNGARPKPKRAW
jgi:hypothetical protein